MRKVRYISGYMSDLTIQRVYDVINSNSRSVLIKNDLGNKRWYYTKIIITGELLFEDVSIMHRNETITEILS